MKTALHLMPEVSWESFRKAVIPKDASEIQLREMKKAFYAGCATMMTIGIVVGEVSEENGIEILDTAYKEIHDFADKILMSIDMTSKPQH